MLQPSRKPLLRKKVMSKRTICSNKKSKQTNDAYFSVLYSPNKVNLSRLTLAISKKRCLLASKRNRIKRIVRESFRHNQNKLIGLDVTVINKVKTKTATNNKLADSLEQHWHKIMINKEKDEERSE
jgi:ribonuclease P protein component